jgi:tetratricopeptide (TPR) repeat protein
MITLRPIASAVLAVCLLQACGAPMPRQEMLVQPASQVRHSANQTASSYYRVGRYHQERGDMELALMAYTYSIARDGTQLEARSAAAAIHAQQGRLDQAKAMLLAVVADYPSVALPYNNLGYVYYLQGDYGAAAEMLRKALALEGTNDRARNNLRLAEAAMTRPAGVAPSNAAPVMPTVPTAAAPVSAAAPTPLPASAMELVELGPNVFELKRRAAPLVAASVPPVPAASPSAPAPVTPARVEIANGNGVTGMAKRIKQVLGRQGIAVSRLTNARPFQQVETTIEYRAGHAQHAEHLRDALRGHAVLVAAPNLPTLSDVRLVLGKDATVHLAWLNTVDSASPIAALALAVPQLEFPL